MGTYCQTVASIGKHWQPLAYIGHHWQPLANLFHVRIEPMELEESTTPYRVEVVEVVDLST